MPNENMTRSSLNEIKKRREAGQLRAPATTAKAEDLGADFWARAKLVEPKPPKSVHLKLDPDVFAFFKQQGKGHLTKMQDVLRAYVTAHTKP